MPKKNQGVIYGSTFAILWALAPHCPHHESGLLLIGRRTSLLFRIQNLSTIPDNNAMLAKKFWAIKF